MTKTSCQECKKEMTYKDAYRCRMCHDFYCEECSLEHFGLYEDDKKTNYVSGLKSTWWVIKKKLLNKKWGRNGID